MINESLNSMLNSGELKRLRQKILTWISEQQPKQSRTLEEIENELLNVLIKVQEDFFGDKFDTIKELMLSVYGIPSLYNQETNTSLYTNILYGKTHYKFYKPNFVVDQATFNKAKSLIEEIQNYNRKNEIDRKYSYKNVTKYLDNCTSFTEVKEDFPEIDFSSVIKNQSTEKSLIRKRYRDILRNEL